MIALEPPKNLVYLTKSVFNAKDFVTKDAKSMNPSIFKLAQLHVKKIWNYKIAPPFRQAGLKNRDFTVISNNCGAGMFGYQELGLQYTTPTVGLFFFFADYIRFLLNLEHYLSIPIQFTELSKYSSVNAHIEAYHHRYPIGVLEDVEICFMHYHSKEEAETKWTRRARRVRLENLFVMLIGDDKWNVCNPDPNFWKPDVVESFKKLPLKNKAIVQNPSKPLSNVLVMSEKFSILKVEHFSMVKWLNGEYSAQ